MKTTFQALVLTALALTAAPAAAAPADAALPAAELVELFPNGQEPLEMAPPANQCKKKDTFQTATFGGSSAEECIAPCETACANQGGTLVSSSWGGGRDPFCYCTCCRN